MSFTNATGLDDLRCFFCVADSGGISAAARRFGLSKATLSRALARLEAQAGTPLVDRIGTGVRLTHAGEALFEAARDAASAGARADEILRAASREPGGTIRIATNALVGHLYLAPVLAQMVRDFPKVHPRIEITSADPDPLAEDIDLVLRVDRPAEPYLVARKIAESPMKLYGPAGFASRFDLTDPDVVATLPRVRIGTIGTPPDWVLTDGKGGRIVMGTDPVVTVTDPAVTLGLISAGAGVALLPSLADKVWVRGGDTVAILPGWSAGNVEVFAVFPPGRTRVPAVRNLIDYVLRSARAFQAGDVPG